MRANLDKYGIFVPFKVHSFIFSTITLRAVEKAEQQPLPLTNLVDPASGNTPLMYAAMENKVALMERLIDQGCSVKRGNRVSTYILSLTFPIATQFVVCNSVRDAE